MAWCLQGNNDRTDTLLPMNHPALPLFPGFTHHQIEVATGLHISAMVGGHGPGLLLLANHHAVELVEQVFGKTGLDLQRCQSLACDVLWGHSAIGP